MYSVASYRIFTIDINSIVEFDLLRDTVFQFEESKWQITGFVTMKVTFTVFMCIFLKTLIVLNVAIEAVVFV